MLKQSMAVLVLACGLTVNLPHVLEAQSNVCVVDVAKIFDSHAGFRAQLEDLKQQAEEYKFSLQQRGEKLRLESEQLRDFEVGSPEYKELESRLAQESANLEVERRNKTREFVQAEAKLHFDVYVQVTNLISQYCEQRGCRVALRYSHIEMDPEEPSSIMQRVNESVVFHRPEIDITPQIIQALGNTEAANAGSSGDGANR